MDKKKEKSKRLKTVAKGEVKKVNNVKRPGNLHKERPISGGPVCVRVKLSPGIRSKEFVKVCKGLAGMSCDGFSYLSERLQANVF